MPTDQDLSIFLQTRSGLKTLITLAGFFPILLFAQPDIDSLIFKSQQTTDDTLRNYLMTVVGERLLYTDPRRSAAINRESLQDSRKIRYQNGIARNLTNLSATFILRGVYDSASLYVDTLMAFAESEDLPWFRIRALNRRAVIQYYQGLFLDGIETNLELLALAEQLKGTEQNKINALNNIGINYEKLLEYDKATEYYLKALDIASTLGNKYNQAAISGNLGVIYKNSGRLQEAEELIRESISLAEEINHQSLLVDELINLTDIYLQQKNFRLARQTNERTLQVAENVEDNNGIIKAIFQTGFISYSQGDFRQAIPSFLESERRAREKDDREELVNIYEHLHLTYEHLDQHDRAYEYLSRQTALKDSIFDQEKTAELDRLEMAYQVAEKDKEILAQELEIIKRTRQRNILIAAAMIIILFGLLVYFFLRKIIRNTREIARQKEMLQDQQIKQLVNEKKIITLDAMLLGQEEERKRIAADLHDSLGSLMATIKGHFSLLAEGNFEPSKENNYQKTDRLINQASNEVRRISHNMMPQALVNHGLIDALEDLARNHAESSNWQLDLQVIGMKTRLPEKYEIMIFRIVQELFANISRHAAASKVLLQVIQKDEILHLTIEDDGRGFIQHQNGNGTGLGLDSVRDRVAYLQGEIDFDSVPGEGTTISINIPVINLISEMETHHE